MLRKKRRMLWDSEIDRCRQRGYLVVEEVLDKAVVSRAAGARRIRRRRRASEQA
jgi:hypothetical protein